MSDPVPSSGRASNPLGRAALVTAAVALLLSVVAQGLSFVLPGLLVSQGQPVATVGIALGATSIVVGLVGAVALVLGLVGLARPDAPRGAAGVAVGVGGTLLLGTIAGLVLGAFANAFLLAAIP